MRLVPVHWNEGQPLFKIIIIWKVPNVLNIISIKNKVIIGATKMLKNELNITVETGIL